MTSDGCINIEIKEYFEHKRRALMVVEIIYKTTMKSLILAQDER